MTVFDMVNKLNALGIKATLPIKVGVIDSTADGLICINAPNLFYIKAKKWPGLNNENLSGFRYEDDYIYWFYVYANKEKAEPELGRKGVRLHKPELFVIDIKQCEELIKTIFPEDSLEGVLESGSLL